MNNNNIELEFEETGCIICKYRKYTTSDTILWKNTKMHFVICQKCGLKYMNPRLTKKFYDSFYKNMFWEEKLAGDGFSFNDFSDKNIKKPSNIKLDNFGPHSYRLISQINDVIQLSSETKILELGTGRGGNLGLIKSKHNCKVFGVEPSDYVKDSASKQFGIKFIGSFVEEFADNSSYDGKFDLVIMSHILENTTNPINSLLTLRKLIKPKGYFYIETPNLYYHYHASNPYHPYIFSPETLELILKVTGFNVLRIHCERNPSNIKTKPNNDSMYLSIVANLGVAQQDIPNVNISKLISEWDRGMSLMGVKYNNESCQMEKIHHKRSAIYYILKKTVEVIRSFIN